jgi:tripartite-type tricarboxylate transporter receptor subunit TctC
MHLSGELFNMIAGIKTQHVPYKGSAPLGKVIRETGARLD